MAQEPTASFGRRLCMHTAGIRSRGCIVAWRVPHLRAMSSMAQISSGFAPKTPYRGRGKDRAGGWIGTIVPQLPMQQLGWPMHAASRTAR